MIGDKQPDKFKRGDRLTAGMLNSIVSSVMSIIRKMYGTRIEQPLNVHVVLDEELSAATAALTNPSTAVCSVYRKNTSGNLVDSGQNITVVNRFEAITIESNTIAKAEWIDGEWQLYAADCEAMGA